MAVTLTLEGDDQGAQKALDQVIQKLVEGGITTDKLSQKFRETGGVGVRAFREIFLEQQRVVGSGERLWMQLNNDMAPSFYKAQAAARLYGKDVRISGEATNFMAAAAGHAVGANLGLAAQFLNVSKQALTARITLDGIKTVAAGLAPALAGVGSALAIAWAGGEIWREWKEEIHDLGEESNFLAEALMRLNPNIERQRQAIGNQPRVVGMRAPDSEERAQLAAQNRRAAIEQAEPQAGALRSEARATQEQRRLEALAIETRKAAEQLATIRDIERERERLNTFIEARLHEAANFVGDTKEVEEKRVETQRQLNEAQVALNALAEREQTIRAKIAEQEAERLTKGRELMLQQARALEMIAQREQQKQRELHEERTRQALERARLEDEHHRRRLQQMDEQKQKVMELLRTMEGDAGAGAAPGMRRQRRGFLENVIGQLFGGGMGGGVRGGIRGAAEGVLGGISQRELRDQLLRQSADAAGQRMQAGMADLEAFGLGADPRALEQLRRGDRAFRARERERIRRGDVSPEEANRAMRELAEQDLEAARERGQLDQQTAETIKAAVDELIEQRRVIQEAMQILAQAQILLGVSANNGNARNRAIRAVR